MKIGPPDSAGPALEVGCQGLADDLRQRDGANGSSGLRRAELGLAGSGQDPLAVDGDRAAEEVDAVYGQAEALALA